jgi:hypothetical protein
MFSKSNKEKFMFIPIVQSPRKSKERRVECDGFFQGAHEVPVESGFEEIDAQFERKSAGLKGRSVEKEKRLEARIEHVDSGASELEQLWNAVRQRNGDRMPPVAMPVLIATIGILALCAESLLLAPAMDLLNVTERFEQLVTSFGLAGISALVYHFCWTSFTSERMWRIWKIACRALGLLLTVGLVCWGVLRGYQVAYAARLAENPLGEFLGKHPILSASFYVLISVGAPLVAAAAAHFAAEELHHWWEWATTKIRIEKLRKNRAVFKKQLEAIREQLRHGLQELSEERKQSRALYVQNYERGRSQGAVQEPFWTVTLRASIASLLYAILFGWAVLIYPPSALVIPLIWLVSFLYFRQQWHSPGPVQFFNLERVRFAERAKDSEDAHQAPRNFRHPEL